MGKYQNVSRETYHHQVTINPTKLKLLSLFHIFTFCQLSDSVHILPQNCKLFLQFLPLSIFAHQHKLFSYTIISNINLLIYIFFLTDHKTSNKAAQQQSIKKVSCYQKKPLDKLYCYIVYSSIQLFFFNQ